MTTKRKIGNITKHLSFADWFGKERLILGGTHRTTWEAVYWDIRTRVRLLARHAWAASRRCFRKSKDMAALKKQLSEIQQLSGMSTLRFESVPTSETLGNLKQLAVMSTHAVNTFSKIDQSLRQPSV